MTRASLRFALVFLLSTAGCGGGTAHQQDAAADGAGGRGGGAGGRGGTTGGRGGVGGTGGAAATAGTGGAGATGGTGGAAGAGGTGGGAGTAGTGGGAGTAGTGGGAGTAGTGGAAGAGGTGGSAGAGGTGGSAGGGTGGTGAVAGTGGRGGTGGSAGTGGGAGAGGATGGSAGTGGTGGTSLRDRFPATRPATITVSGRITKIDNICVIRGTSGGCLAQNDPPCTSGSPATNVSLDLTIDAQDNITVEAPYQDICAPDYFCAVSGPNCPIPTSYPVPLVNQQYLYTPRATDQCRRDSSGVAIQVQHTVDVTIAPNATTLTIRQQCKTRMRNDGTSPTSYVNDSRDWTTVLTF